MVSELEKNLGWYIRKAHVAIQAGLSKLGGVWKATDGPILPFLLDQGIPKDLIVAQFEALECGTYGQHFVKLDALQRHKYRILWATLAGAELKAYNDLAKFLGIDIKPITNQSKIGLFLTRLVSAHPLRVTDLKLRAGCSFVGIPFCTPAEDGVACSSIASIVAPVPGATSATGETLNLPAIDEWIEDDAARFLAFFLQGVYPYLTDAADAAHCKLLYTEFSQLEFDLADLYAGDFDFVKRLMKLFDARETFKETHNPDNNVLGWSLCPLDEMAYWTLRAAVDERCSLITSVLSGVCAELGTTLPTFRISSVPCSSVSESPEDALISLEASASPGTGEATEEATGATEEQTKKEPAEEVPLTTNLVDKLEWWLQRMEASIFSRFVKEHGVVFFPETERNGETLLTAMLSLGHTREDVAAMLTVYQRSAAGEHAVFLNDEEFHVARAIDAIADCIDDDYQFGLFHTELFGPSYEGPTVFSAACQFVGANGGRSLGMICDACYATGIAVPAALSIPEREREHEDDSSDVEVTDNDDSVALEIASGATPVVASGTEATEATEETKESNTDVSMDTEVSATTEVRTAISAITEMLISSEENEGDVASSSTDAAPVAPVVASSSTVVASVPEATEATTTKTIWVHTDLANNLDWWLSHLFIGTLIKLGEHYGVDCSGEISTLRVHLINMFKRMKVAPKDVAIAIDRIQREEASDTCNDFSSYKMHYARLVCAAFFGLSELNRKNLYESICNRPWPGHVTLPDVCRIVQTHGYQAYRCLKGACNRLGIARNAPPKGVSTSNVVLKEISYTVLTSKGNALPAPSSASASTPGGAPTPKGASTPTGVGAELYEAVAPDLVTNLEFWINRACGKTWRDLCGSPKIRTIAECLANLGSREATAARLEWLERQDAGLYCEELDANAFHAVRFVRLAMQSVIHSDTQQKLLDTLTAGMGLFLSQTSVMAQACQIVRYHGTAITSVLSSVCKALGIVLPNPSARAEREEAKALAAMARKFGHAVYTKLLDHYGVSSFYDILDKGVRCADIHSKLFEIKNAPVVASSSTDVAPEVAPVAPVPGATTGSPEATKEPLLAMQAPDLIDHLELWVRQASYNTRITLRSAFSVSQNTQVFSIVAAIEKGGVSRAAIAQKLNEIQYAEYGCHGTHTDVHALRMLCATFNDNCVDQDKRRHLAVALGEPDQYVSPSTTTIHAMALNILMRHGEQTVARLYEACAEAGVVFFNVVGNRTPPSKRNCPHASGTPVVAPVPGATTSVEENATPEKAAETLTPEEVEIPDLIDNLEWWVGKAYCSTYDSLRSHFNIRGDEETFTALEKAGVSRATIAAQLTVIQRKEFSCNASHTDKDVHVIRMLRKVFDNLSITDVRRQFAKEMGVPCYSTCVNARTVSLLILNKHKSGTIAQLKKVCDIMGLDFPAPPQKKSTASASNGVSTSKEVDAEAPLRTFSEEEKTCIEAINDAYVKVVTALMAKKPFVSATKADKVRKELVDNLEWWVNRSSATIRHALCKTLGHPLIYTFFNRHTVADLVGAAIHPALIARTLNDLQQKQVPEPLQFTDEELHVVRLVAATIGERTGDDLDELLKAMGISIASVHDRNDAFREACFFAAKHRENTLPLLATLCSIPTPKTEPPCMSLTCLRCHHVSVSAGTAETSTPVETAETSDSDSDSNSDSSEFESDSDSSDEEEETKESPAPFEKEYSADIVKETFNAMSSTSQQEYVTSILASLGLDGVPFSIINDDSNIVTVRVGVPAASAGTPLCTKPNCGLCRHFLDNEEGRNDRAQTESILQKLRAYVMSISEATTPSVVAPVLASSVPEEAPKEAPKNPEPVAPKATQEQREELFWEGVQQVFVELSIHTIARIATILLPTGPHLAVTKLASELKANNVSHYAVYGCFYRFASPAATDKIGVLINTHID